MPADLKRHGGRAGYSDAPIQYLDCPRYPNLALLAITHYLRDERDVRLEHLCDENPSAAECQED